LRAKDRKKAGVSALPNGLYFKGVYYPNEYGLEMDEAFAPFSQAIENK